MTGSVRLMFKPLALQGVCPDTPLVPQTLNMNYTLLFMHYMNYAQMTMHDLGLPGSLNHIRLHTPFPALLP